MVFGASRSSKLFVQEASCVRCIVLTMLLGGANESKHVSIENSCASYAVEAEGCRGFIPVSLSTAGVFHTYHFITHYDDNIHV